MILSVQPIIGPKGPNYVNTSGHSLTTRMLYSVIPSELYCGDLTLDTLLDDMVADLTRMYEDGLEVQVKNAPARFRLVLLAVKGDWPFLRKSMKLEDWFDFSKAAYDRNHAKVLPSRSLQASLDQAYIDYRDYCHRSGKSTSITNFSLQTLKVETSLGCY
ncbi:unnamed protein product, partial [Symbiodinium natans]